MELFDKVQESVTAIRKYTSMQPEVGIILGSGLSNLAQYIQDAIEIDYSEVPYFPEPTVKGHKRKLIFGKIGNKNVVCLSGRFHYYEGYSMQEVTYPVRVMKGLGVKLVVVSNASGGLNPNQEIGDLMIIKDHINLQPEHPLRGKNEERFGPRFPDMMEAYKKDYVKLGLEIAKKQNLRCEAGVYVAVQGPTFETPSEYKAFHILGGDAVGMSTAPEVIVARHSGMEVFGVSVISDLGYPEDKMKEISHDFVLEAAAAAEPKMTSLVIELISSVSL